MTERTVTDNFTFLNKSAPPSKERKREPIKVKNMQAQVYENKQALRLTGTCRRSRPPSVL